MIKINDNSNSNDCKLSYTALKKSYLLYKVLYDLYGNSKGTQFKGYPMKSQDFLIVSIPRTLNPLFLDIK